MSYGVSGVGTTPYLITAATDTTDSLAASTAQQAIDPFADPNGPFANLNLTTEQQQQIQQIFSQNPPSSGQTPSQLFQQVESVLTPQQQATLKTDLETLAKHHHHHHQGSPTGTDPLSQLDGTDSQAYTASGTPATSTTQPTTVNTDA
jgi:Spy/CpxP family protein refolding chaperone